MTTPSELRGLSEKWRAEATGAAGYNYTAYEEGRIQEKRRCADELDACVNEIRRQLSEGEDDRVCAARYRWLRDTRGPITTHVVTWTRVADDREEYAMVTGDDLDAAIDAALSAQRQGEK